MLFRSIKKRLAEVLEQIDFLEQIYMGDKSKFSFSQEIKDIAVKERQKLCQLSSACYSILRDRKEEQSNAKP